MSYTNAAILFFNHAFEKQIVYQPISTQHQHIFYPSSVPSLRIPVRDISPDILENSNLWVPTIMPRPRNLETQCNNSEARARIFNLFQTLRCSIITDINSALVRRRRAESRAGGTMKRRSTQYDCASCVVYEPIMSTGTIWNSCSVLKLICRFGPANFVYASSPVATLQNSNCRQHYTNANRSAEP